MFRQVAVQLLEPKESQRLRIHDHNEYENTKAKKSDQDPMNMAIQDPDHPGWWLNAHWPPHRSNKKARDPD